MILSIDSSSALLSAIVAAFVGGLRNDPGLDDGYVSLSVRTSHIELKTKCIDRVVALGPRALTPLVQEMKRKETSLDSFARCYSASDQILRNAGLKERVRWHGGLIKTHGKNPRVIGTSRIDGDSPAFRREQVEEIIRSAKEIGVNLEVAY